MLKKNEASLHAYPNPFDDFINISVNINKPGHTLISLYDLNGRLQKVVFNDYLEPGKYSFTLAGTNWQNKSLEKGCYIISVKSKSGNRGIKLYKK